VRHLFILILVVLSFDASAASIVQVSRRLRMSSKEPLPAKDFFFDLGVKDGLRDGDVVAVYRELPVMNGLAGMPEHLLRVPMGEIRVVTAGERVSVGRVHTAREAADLPAMESQSFMMGDVVQLKSGLPFR